jgi:hypothetical protein
MRSKLAPYLAMIVLCIFASPLLLTSSGSAAPSWFSKLPPKSSSTAPPQTSSKKTPVQDISAPLFPKSMSLTAQSDEGGLWRTDGGFQSVMMLKNILLTTKMSVTPVLYMADGTEYDLPPVNLDKGGVAMVNLNNALQSAPTSIQSHISTYGSAAIRYKWAWKNAVGAAIRVGDDGNSLVYLSHLNANANETHSTSAPQVAQTNEGMWWKQEPGVTCFLAMTNTSLNSITANLEVFGSGASYSTPQSVVIAPHNTTLIELGPSWGQLQGSPTEGGLRVSYTGVQGGLQLDGGLMDIAKGYSHKLSLSATPIASSADSTTSSTDATIQAPPALPTINLDSTGMMIGAQDPNMQFPQGTLFAPYEVLRNTSSRAFQVQLTANYLGQSGPADVPLGAIMLSPQEVQQVDLKDLLAAAGLGQYNGLINLRTTYVGNHSDLLAEAGSVDQTMSYVFETPPLWEAGSGARILSYWNTNADTDTMITVWNHSSQPEDLILTFYHQQGQYKLPIHLAANGSTSLSVAALIKGGQPDSAGNVIPPTITQGSGKLTSAKGDLKRMNISLHIGVFNVRTATCTCPCAYCDPLEGQSFSPDSLSLTVGNSSEFAAYIYLADGSYDATSEVSWTSDDAGVATVTSNSSPAVGAGVGVTNIGGIDPNVFDANSGSDCMSGGSFFPSGPQSEQAVCGTASAGSFVIPTACHTLVSFIGGNNFIFVGTDPAIIGNNLQQVSGSPGGGSYAWFGPSGSDFSFSPNFSTTADVVTATSNTASTSIGDKTLTVHYTLNGVGETTPATKAITVRAFKFVTQLSKAPNSIPSGSFGYSYNVTYDCNMAPDGTTLASLGSYRSIPVDENVQQTSSNSSLTAVINSGSGTTNANSEFVDLLKLVSSTALPSNLQIVYSQIITIQSVAVRSNTLTFGPTTVNITNNGPTQ